MSTRQFTAALLLAVLTGWAHADDSTANPKYIAWSTFKPGSVATVEADIQVQGKRVHIKTTQTLLSISEDEVVVQTVSISSATGQKETRSTKRETFKAKGSSEAFKLTGEDSVDAMGRTFKCKVYEGRKKSSSSAEPAFKGTVYLSDNVPGGMVKLETVGADGKTPVTFVLTAMQAKQ